MRDPMTEKLASYWAESLATWAIPEEILARAPASPWEFPVGLFSRSAALRLARDPDTPSYRRAVEAMLDSDREGEPGSATVLDVGAGAGAASLPLVPPAGRVVAIDEREEMLASLRELAAARQIDVETIRGRWPEVSDLTPAADVVVCHHVLYNVAEVVPFVEALDAHAKRRVVVEITSTHPLSHLNELWRVIHGLDRPNRPTAHDAVTLISSLGIAPQVEEFTRLSRWSEGDRAARVARARQHVCTGPEHDDVIEALLSEEDQDLVTISWDPSRRSGP